MERYTVSVKSVTDLAAQQAATIRKRAPSGARIAKERLISLGDVVDGERSLDDGVSDVHHAVRGG